ncbi:MAG: succinate dehydrogenase assembly factor 2 [Thiobacillus sp.]|nr:succinate dehydrogenase assembly factor 2 [Thiobacillus sp.]
MSAELNRLRWRCQRGMLELDHILGGFLDAGYAEAPSEVRDAFAALLAMEDADILDLILGAVPPATAAQASLMARLRHLE